MNRFKNWIRDLMKIDEEVDTAVEDTISAAETLIPDFAKIRDEKAKEGVEMYKDGKYMVRVGTREMEDGAENVELARKLGSRVKIRKP